MCCSAILSIKKKQPYDDCSHGTHVSGIICGSGKKSSGRFMGIAPKSRLISLKVLTEEETEI